MSTDTRSGNPDISALFGPDNAITRADTLASSLADALSLPDAPAPDALARVMVAAHARLQEAHGQIEKRYQALVAREKAVAEREARALAHERRLAAIETLAPLMGDTPRGKSWWRS